MLPCLACPPAGLQVGYCLRAFSHDADAASQRQNVQTLVEAVRAVTAQYGTAQYHCMQQACMALDVSWARPAAEWEAVLSAAAAVRAAARGAAA